MIKKSVCVLVFSLNVIFCEYSNSPCPDKFDFETDGRSVYGKFILRPSGGLVSSLVVNINFTVAAQVFYNYVGQIEAEDNILLLQKYNVGLPISYRVHFPMPSPLPKLTALTVNGDKVCFGPGDRYRSNTNVTSLFLQHTFRPGGGPVYTNVQPQQPPQSISDPTPINEDAQVIVHAIDLTSTTGNTSRDVLSNSDPFSPPTQQPPYQQPTEPVFKQPRPAQNQLFVNRPVLTERPVDRRRPYMECGVVADDNESSPQFYSGDYHARGDMPWLAAIYRIKGESFGFICGGTLVSNRHVVSAAICVRYRPGPFSNTDFLVKLGAHDLNARDDDITVTRTLKSATVHESFNSSTLANNILVFTLNTNVEFNAYIRPACLWTGNTELSYVVGSSGVFAGWGDQSQGGVSGKAEPHRLRMPIVSTKACTASKPEFYKITSEYTLCAGDRNGQGPCIGDSGCGLYLRDGGKWRLRGIVSLTLLPFAGGAKNCNLDEYVVFTDTAQYLSWIRNVIFETLYE